MKEESKLIELFKKNTPELLHAYGGHLLITTTKSNEEEHAEEIEYYLNFLEKPETLYTFTENTINFFKSLIK